MPSTATRIHLTLPDEVVAVLDSLGKLTGAGRATIIREWLIEGLPIFQQMASAADEARQKNVDALKIMANALRDASQFAEQTELDLRRKHRAARRKRTK
jgi:predicted DNA-binding protein